MNTTRQACHWGGTCDLEHGNQRGIEGGEMEMSWGYDGIPNENEDSRIASLKVTVRYGKSLSLIGKYR